MATPNNYRRPAVTVNTSSSRPVDVTGSQVEITNFEDIATIGKSIPVSVDSEILTALESLRMSNDVVASQLSRFMPDSSGRNRVAIETGGVTISSGTVTTVTTVTTTGTLTNQTNIGGIAANPQIPTLMLLGGDNLRRNIIVS